MKKRLLVLLVCVAVCAAGFYAFLMFYRPTPPALYANGARAALFSYSWSNFLSAIAVDSVSPMEWEAKGRFTEAETIRVHPGDRIRLSNRRGKALLRRSIQDMGAVLYDAANAEQYRAAPLDAGPGADSSVQLEAMELAAPGEPGRYIAAFHTSDNGPGRVGGQVWYAFVVEVA